ncbi:MAG: hypothetical protein V4594_05285 [Bacteroidota bacterium]
MIDISFCEFLEYEICKALKTFDHEEIKGFWCDGILMSQPAYSYSHKFVNDNREVNFTAFIGEDGQQEYELILKFGKKALSRFARNLDIECCIPNSEESEWFSIDIGLNKVEIQLH